MSSIKHIIKKVKVDDIKEIVGAQILMYSYLKNIWLNKSEFDTLIFISLNGYNKENTLKNIVDSGIFKSEQCVRNARNKLVKLGLLVEPSKRYFEINPEINIENKGRVLYDLKMININEA